MHDLSHERRRVRWPRPGRRALRRSNRVSPTFFQRFECKYLIDPLAITSIRNYLAPFVRTDGFARKEPDGRYRVSSLYLDSTDLSLYQQTQAGEKDRFKLRVRTYDDDPAQPAYVEVKRKVNNVVHKRRVGLARDDARALLMRHDPATILNKLSGSRMADAEFFAHHMERLSAVPAIRVQYMREAYEATGNEPVRVTLDSELRYAVTLNDDLGHSSGDWVETPLNGIIIEIKFTERFPSWVKELIRGFELRQQSVPKYILSVEHALLRRATSEVSIAGLSGPAMGS
jgi:hypothetical protein